MKRDTTLPTVLFLMVGQEGLYNVTSSHDDSILEAEANRRNISYCDGSNDFVGHCLLCCYGKILVEDAKYLSSHRDIGLKEQHETQLAENKSK